jgi:ABC-type sulfate/molybdate transport systems ATPase subunit
LAPTWPRSSPTSRLFVTHDQEEALEVADRVVLLHQGRVEQVGTPEEIFRAPASAFVSEFLEIRSDGGAGTIR